MIRRPPRSTRKESSAASDVYKRQIEDSSQLWKFTLKKVMNRNEALKKELIITLNKISKAGCESGDGLAKNEGGVNEFSENEAAHSAAHNKRNDHIAPIFKITKMRFRKSRANVQEIVLPLLKETASIKELAHVIDLLEEYIVECRSAAMHSRPQQRAIRRKPPYLRPDELRAFATLDGFVKLMPRRAQERSSPLDVLRDLLAIAKMKKYCLEFMISANQFFVCYRILKGGSEAFTEDELDYLNKLEVSDNIDDEIQKLSRLIKTTNP
eukprot:TRINITY_DN3626_c0_g3_i2.p1 TRINITY_DN3626_c0_g3~~TRINITY_DN3626_c0_g3_i2.p1  ORF type:complete len:275 (-),score=57.48 TRINITY_DN3626_c0_g3_i2:54-857(-)